MSSAELAVRESVGLDYFNSRIRSLGCVKAKPIWDFAKIRERLDDLIRATAIFLCAYAFAAYLARCLPELLLTREAGTRPMARNFTRNSKAG